MKYKVEFDHIGTLHCTAIVHVDDASEITDPDTNIFDIAEDINDDGFDGDNLIITHIELIGND